MPLLLRSELDLGPYYAPRIFPFRKGQCLTFTCYMSACYMRAVSTAVEDGGGGEYKAENFPFNDFTVTKFAF